MRYLWIPLLLLVAVEAVLVSGSLLGYPLFLGLREFGVALPFHKCTHYSALTLAFLLGLAWLLSRPGAAEGLLAGPRRQVAWQLASGALLGLLLLGTLEGLLLLTRARALVDPASFSWGGLVVQVGKGLATGSAVGLIEEIIFRGALLGILWRLLGMVPAALLSSAIFAVLHFVRPAPWRELQDPSWYSGLELLLEAHVQAWLNLPWNFMPALVLFGLGLLLALFRIRSGVLWHCFGFHLGVVVGLRIARYCAYSVPEVLPPWIYDPNQHPMGGLALGLMVFLYLALLLTPARREKVLEPVEERESEAEGVGPPFIDREFYGEYEGDQGIQRG